MNTLALKYSFYAVRKYGATYDANAGNLTNAALNLVVAWNHAHVKTLDVGGFHLTPTAICKLLRRTKIGELCVRSLQCMKELLEMLALDMFNIDEMTLDAAHTFNHSRFLDLTKTSRPHLPPYPQQRRSSGHHFRKHHCTAKPPRTRN